MTPNLYTKQEQNKNFRNLIRYFQLGAHVYVEPVGDKNFKNMIFFLPPGK